MSFSENRLIKKARMLHHAHRGLPNVLKARFSPTAIFTPTESDDSTTPTASATTTTDDDITPTTTRATRATPTPTSLATQSTPTTSTSSTPAAVVSSATSSSIVLTSSTSTKITTSLTTSSTTSTPSTTTTTTASSTHTTTTSSSTIAAASSTTALLTRSISSHVSSSATSLSFASSASASATSTATSSSGVSTAGIVGIAAAGVIGSVVVVGLVMFFLRRKWNNNQDDFDADAFRRQSVFLQDDGSSLHRDNNNGRGESAPRPPTMFERHHQNIATFADSSASYYQASEPYPGSANPFDDPSSHQSSFGPGMYMTGPPMPPAPSAQYADASPFYNPPSQSPMGSPMTVASYGGVTYDTQGGLARTTSNSAMAMLSRNNSVAHPPYPPQEAEYADLTRSSVTPFQAAQYEAISRQLNIPAPKPLQQVSEAEEMDELKPDVAQNASTTKHIDVGYLPSPFENTPASLTKDTGNTAGNENATNIRVSSEILAAPEPASSMPSQPPSLPEIKTISSTFSPVSRSFPVTPSPRKGSFDIHSGRASPKVDLPPLTPVSSSPQRARFVDGLEARTHDGHETPVEIGFVEKDSRSSDQVAGARPETPKTDVVKSEVVPKAGELKGAGAKRPDTIYSDEDAYGGY